MRIYIIIYTHHIISTTHAFFYTYPPLFLVVEPSSWTWNQGFGQESCQVPQMRQHAARDLQRINSEVDGWWWLQAIDGLSFIERGWCLMDGLCFFVSVMNGFNSLWSAQIFHILSTIQNILSPNGPTNNAVSRHWELNRKDFQRTGYNIQWIM